jgi:hypothetical protein
MIRRHVRVSPHFGPTRGASGTALVRVGFGKPTLRRVRRPKATKEEAAKLLQQGLSKAEVVVYGADTSNPNLDEDEEPYDFIDSV